MAAGKAQFKVGDVVMHKKLGKGDVLDVYPLGEETCLVISFEKVGQRKVILKFANLELVSRAKGEPERKAGAQAAAAAVEDVEVEVGDDDDEVEVVAEEEQEEAEEEKS
jgi:hypothetical protein